MITMDKHLKRYQEFFGGDDGQFSRQREKVRPPVMVVTYDEPDECLAGETKSQLSRRRDKEQMEMF